MAADNPTRPGRYLVGLALAMGAAGCQSGRAVPASPGPTLAWAFEAPDPGTVAGCPFVTADAVYLAATQTRGPEQRGVVFALDAATGKPRWTFDRDGRMRPTTSSPLVAGDRLFVGEGVAGRPGGGLQCLDAATGKPVWDYPTADRVEGGPAAGGELVVFPAGNDGLVAVEAATGRRRWSHREGDRVDAPPAVIGDRVFVVGRSTPLLQDCPVVSLDLATGKRVWQRAMWMPARGAPRVAGGRVYLGLGNGGPTADVRPPELPSGSVVCLGAGTGELFWMSAVGNAICDRPAVVDDRIIAGSRDENLYGFDLNGHEVFRIPMGGAVVGGPAVTAGRAYAVSVSGRLVCVEPATGAEVWRHELGRPGVEPRALAPPVAAGRRLFLAAEMDAGGKGTVTVFCFDLPDGEGKGG